VGPRVGEKGSGAGQRAALEHGEDLGSRADPTSTGELILTPSPIDRRTAEHYVWGEGECDGWFLEKRSDLHVIEERLPPGAGEKTHVHQRAGQFFYVLAGSARFTVDGRSVTLAQGQGISIAPGTPHRVENPGTDDLSLLVISHPPSHGDRVDLPTTPSRTS
jgi:mannose-6-phosphate isomerase-like protein (cupin superfamily)